MSILIKGMEMPTSCSTCFITWCIGRANNPQVMVQRDADCPLIEIPPHGRLIDADAPIKVWEVKLSDDGSCSFRNIETTVSKFLLSHLIGEVPPTIIPADQE